MAGKEKWKLGKIIIGLEVHASSFLKFKAFSDGSASFGSKK